MSEWKSRRPKGAPPSSSRLETKNASAASTSFPSPVGPSWPMTSFARYCWYASSMSRSRNSSRLRSSKVRRRSSTSSSPSSVVGSRPITSDPHAGVRSRVSSFVIVGRSRSMDGSRVGPPVQLSDVVGHALRCRTNLQTLVHLDVGHQPSRDEDVVLLVEPHEHDRVRDELDELGCVDLVRDDPAVDLAGALHRLPDEVLAVTTGADRPRGPRPATAVAAVLELEPARRERTPVRRGVAVGDGQRTPLRDVLRVRARHHAPTRTAADE